MDVQREATNHAGARRKAALWLAYGGQGDCQLYRGQPRQYALLFLLLLVVWQDFKAAGTLWSTMVGLLY